MKIFSRKPAVLFLLLVSLSLLIRLLIYFYVLQAEPLKFALKDVDGYLNIAQNLLDQGIYSREPSAPYYQDLTRPPVYPILLVTLLKITSFNGPIIIFLQTVIGSLLSGFLFLSGIEFGLGKKISTILGVILAFDPIIVLSGHYLLTETIFLFFWILGILFFLKFIKKNRVGFLLISAFFFGFSALTRPVVLYYPLLLIPLLLVLPLNTLTKKLRYSAGFLIVFLLLITPWMLRNQIVGGVFSLSTIPDINLYFYRAKAVFADSQNISQEMAFSILHTELTNEVTENQLTPGQTQVYMRKRSVQILTIYPIETIKMTLIGSARLLLDPGYSLICTALDPKNLTPECFEGQATMLESNLFQMMWSRVLLMNLLQKVILIISVFFTAGYYIFGLLGVINLIKKKNYFFLALLLGSITYFVVTSSGAESLYQLRLPFIPFLALLVGISIKKFLGDDCLHIPEYRINCVPKKF